MLDDLWRLLDASGRDQAEVDVSFTTLTAEGPGDAGFSPDAHLEALAELADLGVTWCSASVPADSLHHAVEALQRYGELVIGV